MTTRRQFIAGAAACATLAATRATAQRDSLTDMTLEEASHRIRTRELSPVELTRAYLERIDRVNPVVNAYVRVTAELALEQAAQREAELVQGRWRGPLHGIPIALKDNIDTANIPTTAASALFADRVPDEDAEVWRRLRDGGAVLLGKLNLHELAYGGTSAITHFGPVRNPWNIEHIPGGSSGGSAAAMAARLCCGALGTDTLASIRQPAAYCNVTGLKATHGLVSIRGIIPVSESLDHVGPMCRSVADSALMLEVMAGFDPLDPVSIRAPRQRYQAALYRSAAELRIGVPRSPYYERLHPDVDTAVQAALGVMERIGGGMHEVALPPAPDFAALLAEAHAYHREHLAAETNRILYDEITLERILAAGEFSAAQYYEARREMALARHAIEAVFEEVDLLVTPTTPGLPEPIEHAENPAEAAGAEPSVRNTYPFNVYGIPTVSVPCGFSQDGLPIGLQISGRRLGEPAVLALAHAYQLATDWHDRRPPL